MTKDRILQTLLESRKYNDWSYIDVIINDLFEDTKSNTKKLAESELKRFYKNTLKKMPRYAGYYKANNLYYITDAVRIIGLKNLEVMPPVENPDKFPKNAIDSFTPSSPENLPKLEVNRADLVGDYIDLDFKETIIRLDVNLILSSLKMIENSDTIITIKLFTKYYLSGKNDYLGYFEGENGFCTLCPMKRPEVN